MADQYHSGVPAAGHQISDDLTAMQEMFQYFAACFQNFCTGWAVADSSGLEVDTIADSTTLVTPTLTTPTATSITETDKPCFLAYADANQENITVGSDVKLNFATEVYDKNSDYSTVNSAFTAPATGVYHFDASVQLVNVDLESDNIEVFLRTTSGDYPSNITIDDFSFNNDLGYLSIPISTDVSLAVGHTAAIYINITAGDTQTDTLAGRAKRFSGRMVFRG